MILNCIRMNGDIYQREIGIGTKLVGVRVHSIILDDGVEAHRLVSDEYAREWFQRNVAYRIRKVAKTTSDNDSMQSG